MIKVYFKMLNTTCAALLLVFLALVEGAPNTTADIASGDDTDKEYCPGYRPGNPALASDVEDCRSGSEIGVVGHSYAFGLNPQTKSPNWTSCGIPSLPGENERVCYKTTVLQCGDGYRIYLNKRNFQKLQSKCPNETDSVLTSPSGDKVLQSPRYGCRKPPFNRRNIFFPYRRKEFCLYDVSVPDCPSGRVRIHNDEHYTQELEQRQRYHICSDYLQMFTDTAASKRYCDSELSRINLEIPATRFTALFWTDTTVNQLGFRLSVSCIDEDS